MVAHPLFRWWIVLTRVKTLFAFGRLTATVCVGVVSFLKAPSWLFLMLRDALGEDPDPLDWVVVALRVVIFLKTPLWRP